MHRYPEVMARTTILAGIRTPIWGGVAWPEDLASELIEVAEPTARSDVSFPVTVSDIVEEWRNKCAEASVTPIHIDQM